MKLASTLAASVLVVAVATTAWTQQPGDSVTVSQPTGLVGEQVLLTLEVVTAAGAIVEVDPSNDAWGGLEVIRVQRAETTVAGETALHRLEVVVAGFGLGPLRAQPVVNILEGTAFTQRTLPAVEFEVIASLAPGAPLELTPLATPVAIGGGESPLLLPAMIAGAGGAALAVAGAGWLLLGRVLRRRTEEAGVVEAPPLPELGLAVELLEADPVGAYRTMAATVRAALAERYRFPARALTTRELQRRMEDAGVDRWEARLVAGLLQECDSVVYAGYRPAAERRQSDLTMAREILEAAL